MPNYEEARVKLTNTHINNLKSAAKNKTVTTSRRIKVFKTKNCLMNYFYKHSKKKMSLMREVIKNSENAVKYTMQK